jgi:hypothetical protein
VNKVHVVDAETLPWVNGREVYESMEPAFRENLDVHGDQERVLDLLSRYSIRTLWLDPATTRRIDHLRAATDYVDLSEAYHDSVEEALFLGGRVTLSAEGVMEPGDYFWRPPGWVHSAASAEGFEAILMMEGEVASEGSGRVSRVPRADDRVGHNDRPASVDDPIGPRGYVRHLETRFMVWRDHDDTVTGLVGDDATASGLTSKVLSSNAVTDACSALVRLPEGWSSSIAPSTRERFLVVADGTVEVDGATLGPGSLVHLDAGAGNVAVASPAGAELLVKVGEPR